MTEIVLGILMVPFMFLYMVYDSFLWSYVFEKLSLQCTFRWEVQILDYELWKFTTINTYHPNDFFLQKHKIIITSPENLPMNWVEISGLKSRFWTSLKEYTVIDSNIIWWKYYSEYPGCKKFTISQILPFIQYTLVLPILFFCILYLRKLKKKK